MHPTKVLLGPIFLCFFFVSLAVTLDSTESAFAKTPLFLAPELQGHFGPEGPESQKFRKGVGRQRGLARGNPSKARDSGLFSVPSFLCPLRRMGTHFWRIVWVLFGGLFVANPLPPTPFRNLRERRRFRRKGGSFSR